MDSDMTFEARLGDALGRLAELAPTMDDAAVARRAIVAGGSARSGGWLASLRNGAPRGFGLGRPMLRAAYLLIILALVLVAILAAIAGGAFRNDSFPSSGRNGAIAFTFGGNNHEPVVTHLVNPDGKGDRPIDAGRCPTYSRDGSVLASLSYDGSAYLAVSAANGDPVGRVLLVEGSLTSVSYALSPEGTRVAWFKPIPANAAESPSPDGGSATIGDRLELWVAPIAGGPGTRIVTASNLLDDAYESPLWSPDGGRIAFAGSVADGSGERHRSAIYVVDVDDAELRRLTTRPALLGDGMSWSPDGRFLAYPGLPDGAPIPPSSDANPPVAYPPRDVFLIGADGSGDRNLTSTPASESQPDWSPDGAYLAFGTAADGEAHRITAIHMNGPTPGGPPALGPESEWFVWSPDGTALLWLEVSSLGSEKYRSTLHSVDRDFRQAPLTLQAVDGLIVCKPSWQRLEP
jgi:WD40 repeat protein